MPFTVLPAFRERDLTFFHQGVQHFLKFAPLFPRDLEHSGDLLYLHRHIEIITDKIKYHLFTFFKCLVHVPLLAAHTWCS